MWLALDVFDFPQVAQHRYRHDGLAQAHVVSQNAVHFVLIKTSHPLQGVELVLLKLPEAQAFRLTQVLCVQRWLWRP